jgi:hypothetical protein
MQELLLLYACTNNTGCSASISAYSYHNPEIVKNYDELYAKVYKTVPNVVVQYILPTISVINQKKATLKLSNQLITEVSSESISISYVIEY